MPDHPHSNIPISALLSLYILGQIHFVLVTCLISNQVSLITFKSGHFVCFLPMQHNTRPYFVLLYQFQLIGFFPVRAGFSIMTGKHVDSAHVCFSITCYKNADGLYLRVYCTKNEGGKNSMCHKKYQNPVSHLRFGTHPHITSMIYINS